MYSFSPGSSPAEIVKVDMTPIQVLQRTYKDAKFKSPEQLAGLEHVMKQSGNNAMVILPCGGGKSALYMLPAKSLWQFKVTIVVSPLLSLIKDQLRQCKKLGIQADHWSSSNKCGPKSLIYVTPETVTKTSFINVAKLWDVQQIVIDEVHTVIIDDHREDMKDVGPQLRKLNKPFLLLSATVPPSMESKILSELTIPKDTTDVIRASTSRPDIAYKFEYVGDSEGEREVLKEELLKAMKTMDAKDRTIVYFRSKENLVQTQEYFLKEGYDFPYYFSKNQLNEDNMKRWTQGSTKTDQIIFATTALLLGIDNPCVRLVILVGLMFDALSAEQAGGRINRDGKKPGTVLTIATSQYSDKPLTQEYKKLIDKPGCHRQNIHAYLDGPTLAKSSACKISDPRAMLCTNCEKTKSLMPPPSASGSKRMSASEALAHSKAKRHKPDDSAYIPRLTELVIPWRALFPAHNGKRCLLCHLKNILWGSNLKEGHPIEKCMNRKHLFNWKHQFIVAQKKGDLADFLICFKCMAPSNMSEKHPGNNCEYRDLCHFFIYAALHHPPSKAELEKAFPPIKGMDTLRIQIWLFSGLNYVKTLLWVMEYFEKLTNREEQ
jgi:superfamily II DNA or RNA helicase